MTRPVQPKDDVPRATLAFLARPHPRLEAPDEEVHVSRIDPAERDLELALARYEGWKKWGRWTPPKT